MRIVMAALIAFATAAPAFAYDDEFRDARIRYLEPGVMLQRASESSAEDADTNLPFLPGDRVWTDGGGRVEFQFADGSLLSLDNRSKLDYVAHDEERGDRIVLRLWSGSAFLKTRNGDSSDFEIETPTARVTARELGSMRVDSEQGETRLSVFEGSASLEAGRRNVVVEAGERSWADSGDTPELPRRFDERARDDFDRWNDGREERMAWSGGSSQYLPEEIDPYASELESHGSWYFVAEVGHVWRPYVSPGWRPYTDGRWAWTSYGWTWIPNESWGWAPFHYGRWGYSEPVGWYWIPGRTWGPAWVSWAVGSSYVGWCPLGFRDRPVVFQRAVLGHAVPRGGFAAVGQQGTTAWTYARRGDLSARDLAKRRIDAPRPEVTQDIRVVDSPRSRPTRDFKIVDGDTAVRREGGIPRNAKVKPTPGDTVPELQVDRTTTIPSPLLRRPRLGSDDGRYDRATTTRETDRGTTRNETARERNGEPTRDTRSRDASPTHDTDRGQRSHETYRGPETSRERPATNRSEPDREVLRPIFRPLSEPGQSEPRRSEPSRGEPRGAEPRSVPHNEPRSASPPSRSEPRSAPAQPDRQNHQAPRPPKDHSNR